MKFKVVLRIKKDYKTKRKFYVLKRNYTINNYFLKVGSKQKVSFLPVLVNTK